MHDVNVVWLKRDLRLQDHKPLHEAEKAGLPYLIIFIFELEMLDYPDTSLRHLQFVYHSIQAMNQGLARHGREVIIFHENAEMVFQNLFRQYRVHQLLSHRESGIELTWKRDKRVKQLTRQYDVEWNEYQRDGIQRGITNREGWDLNWHVAMHEPIVKNHYSKQVLSAFNNPFPLQPAFEESLKTYPEYYQPAGEIMAWKYLGSFAEQRGFKYAYHISKPNESRTSCSRLSPYLAWGNISIKQAYQFVKHHPNYSKAKRSFSGMFTRLKWHCHFIQKFEVECAYEHSCVNSGYELLERTNDPVVLEAWKTGNTGYPLVDACMRCVITTGWINFRMRAMLVSFLCHHLDHDWRNGAHHLACQFLDYEPGIHYPQFQMQAGTTGVNTVRIYNPIKQSTDHDPEGHFIKKWVPELAALTKEHIHEPWKMTVLDQSFYGINMGRDYPMPIVDLQKSAKAARDKIWGHRKNEKVKAEGQRILATHTRRTSAEGDHGNDPLRLPN